MIQLFGIRSPYVFRVRAALIFKGLPFEHVSVNLRDRSDVFKALTPVGKIPVLQDEDGTVVWDSLNIVRYLDIKYPDTYQMWHGDAATQARIGNVVALADKIGTASTPLYLEKIGFPAAPEAEKEKARTIIADGIQRLFTMLDGREYFTERFSHADSSVIATLGSLQYFGEDIGVMRPWFSDRFRDEKIVKMFPDNEEKGMREI